MYVLKKMKSVDCPLGFIFGSELIYSVGKCVMIKNFTWVLSQLLLHNYMYLYQYMFTMSDCIICVSCSLEGCSWTEMSGRY